MAKSAVAGVVDRKGGMRVVVTQPWRMRHHVEDGERLFVVPKLRVQEPVPWDEIPIVIAKAEKHVRASLRLNNKCGDCKKCCVTLFLRTQQFTKPSHTACQHHSTLTGCTIYKDRPLQCSTFKCHWLKSQGTRDAMPESLRPDRCGVILTDDTTNGDPNVIEMHADIPEDTSRGVFAVHKEWLSSMGKRMKLVTYYYGEEK
jgi:hypothetical protein